MPTENARGTTPAGAATEEQAARWVRGMFGRIAPRYDLLNSVLSFQLDRYWRSYTVRQVRAKLQQPDARVLDLACGSGALLLALGERRRQIVYGSDFCHPMLVAAQHKAQRQRLLAPLFEADALQLPLADASLDLITVAFGFRNFANYERGLQELRRVLRPGGVLAILEFTTPPNTLFRAAYHWYSRRILPWIGGWLSGSRDAYTYLPESVAKFPGASALADQMRDAGYDRVQWQYLTGGIVALHLGQVAG